MHHPALDPLLEGDVYVPETERRLPESLELDSLSTTEILALLASQDRVAVDAVAAVAPQLAALVDIAVSCVLRGGSVHYFGAGTSGRLAVLDAAELLPTFNIEPGVVVAHMAGGPRALVHAVENAEDSVEDGRREAATLGPDDVAIGLTASGNTPFVGGALERARELGAHSALISCNPRASLAALADSDIVLRTGAEVVTGSTRLKAGTAEKLALNGFSTALMVALGRTWSNLMVSVVATNEKLRRRTLRILMQSAGVSQSEGTELLTRADGDLKVAIVTAVAAVPVDRAQAALAGANGSVRAALTALEHPAA
ncbi:N-acetylmuramic acid 6-phosphate etherase [Herbiconiux sp. CPCC 205763]|uniref:N-acetylmuramic acid 6-phosphate etherase n=1 Tax=Herbiconiux aconitum TaxID=2970913 RepID=A0ABT2GQ01_9MICO|nr:N-acetylmuramic acid 6-phosphate etherase [Herbiconiux aconitum]MCS5718288.1 N-acetylmuramic acid 6-phosphate etherase [Herbiconiux aconitum]